MKWLDDMSHYTVDGGANDALSPMRCMNKSTMRDIPADCFDSLINIISV